MTQRKSMFASWKKSQRLKMITWFPVIYTLIVSMKLRLLWVNTVFLKVITSNPEIMLTITSNNTGTQHKVTNLVTLRFSVSFRKWYTCFSGSETVRFDLPPVRPNGLFGPCSRVLIGGRPTLHGWWAPVAQRYKGKVGAGARNTRFTAPPVTPPTS